MKGPLPSQGSLPPVNLIPYPTGRARELMRLPLLLYRLGLAQLMGLLPIMVLTTRGCKTGLARHTILEYRQHGSKLYLISIWGSRPAWFRNLLADPLVTVQVGARRFAARARRVESEGEAVRVLYLFRRRIPGVYDAVIARISGQPEVSPKTLPDLAGSFTIVRLDRLPDAPLPVPPVQADMAWVVQIGVLAGVAVLALTVFARVRRS